MVRRACMLPQIGGKIAMVPRYSNGVWWSRWYNYNNEGMKYIVDSYKSRSMPLDGAYAGRGDPFCPSVSLTPVICSVREQSTFWTWTGTPRTTCVPLVLGVSCKCCFRAVRVTWGMACVRQWGGYTIDPHLFPYPEDTWGDWLHTQGLHMGANLHDATGVYASEATFDAMCKALQLNPATTKDIPFNIMSSEYVVVLWWYSVPRFPQLTTSGPDPATC